MQHIQPNVILRTIGQKKMLINIKTNQLLELNETSAYFFELLKEKGTINAAAISEEFGVAIKIVNDDINTFISILEEHDLLIKD